MRKSLDLRALFIFVFLLLAAKSASAQSSLAEIAPRVRKELLTIRSRERPSRQGQTYDPIYYFSKQPAPAGQESYPLASGFALPGGTLIATSARAVDHLETVEAVSASGKVQSARVIGIDSALDLAILRLEGKGLGLAGLDFGDSRQSRPGDALYVFGRSIKSILLRTSLASTDVGEGAFGRHWLIDQPTSPAVAGGPVVDGRGRVLGMAVYAANGPDQFGTVLPAALIQAAAKDLVAHGKPQRAWLGLVPRAKVNLDELDHIRGADVKGGILVENLIVDGPAATSGLLIGDFILAIDGRQLTTVSELLKVLDKKKAGDVLGLRIYRANKGTMELKLRLGDLPNARELPNADDLL